MARSRARDRKRFRWVDPDDRFPTDLAPDEFAVGWAIPGETDELSDDLAALFGHPFANPDSPSHMREHFRALAQAIRRGPKAAHLARDAARDVLAADKTLSRIARATRAGTLCAEAAAERSATVALSLAWAAVRMNLRVSPLSEKLRASLRAEQGRRAGGVRRAKKKRADNAARDDSIRSEMPRLIDKLGSERSAAARIARKFGLSESHVRRIYRREKPARVQTT